MPETKPFNRKNNPLNCSKLTWKLSDLFRMNCRTPRLLWWTTKLICKLALLLKLVSLLPLNTKSILTLLLWTMLEICAMLSRRNMMIPLLEEKLKSLCWLNLRPSSLNRLKFSEATVKIAREFSNPTRLNMKENRVSLKLTTRWSNSTEMNCSRKNMKLLDWTRSENTRRVSFRRNLTKNSEVFDDLKEEY